MPRDFSIQASSKGTKAETKIRTGDPGRAVRFAKLLAASGQWDSISISDGKRTFTMENLDQLL